MSKTESIFERNLEVENQKHKIISIPPDTSSSVTAMKYVLVTGGVISGIGKGVVASSVGVILKHCNVPATRCAKIIIKQLPTVTPKKSHCSQVVP